jgi:hypothetical protein
VHNGKISAFDWEYGEIDGLPRIDEIHFRLQTGLELRKWSVDDALSNLRRMGAPEWMPHEEQRMRAVQAVYLLDHLARLLAEGYTPEHDIVSTYEQLLTRMNIAKREAALV